MLHHLDTFLQSIPPISVYLLIFAVICIESLGIPIPGETALIAAALMSSQHHLAVSPLWVAVAGACGAIVGDTIGYTIGRKVGHPLFAWLGRKFPKHFGPGHVAYAEHIFDRFGPATVFIGRFIAFMRIFAGPLAGALKMPYRKFLAANAAGGIVWAFGMTFAIYYVGVTAEHFLKNAAWIALVIAVAIALIIGKVMGSKINQKAKEYEEKMAEDRVSNGA